MSIHETRAMNAYSHNTLSKRTRIYIRFFLLFVPFVILNGCSDSPESVSAGFRIGMVFDAAGKDDLSFNTNAWRGSQMAKEEFDIEISDIEPGDPSMIEPAIRTLAEQNYDLIIGVGFANAPYIEKVSGEYPGAHFVIVDTRVEGPNVASLLFEEHEGAFLVGMAAGMLTTTNKIGFIGGMNIPIIHRYHLGYKSGAEYVNPDIDVFESYAGVTMDAWNDPTKGKEMALSQISRGADIVFAAAGATGLGAFDAAEEQGARIIGCDANQNYIKPGYVLTSMLKRLEVAVYEIIKQSYLGEFKAGDHIYSIKNNGIGYAVDEYNRDLLPPDVIERLEEAKTAIIEGWLEVPDYYDTLR
ncbi:BMP family protein [candidate division KSB1 bacterium]